MYKNIEDIKTAFIKDGWSENIEFSEVTENEIGSCSMAKALREGRKFFKMLSSGNIYDDKGDIFFFNIPVAKTV